MKKLFLFLILTVSLIGCKKHADHWVGFYYPEGAPRIGEAVCEIHEFETENECKEWGIMQSAKSDQSEYYCGYRCVYDSSCQYACQNK